MLCRPVARFLTAVALMGPALALPSCGHGHRGAALSAATRPSTDPQNADPSASNLAAGQLITMSPTGLRLPVFLGRVGTPERQFAVAAARALRLIYDDDSDDASLLLALTERLEALPSVQAQRAWRPIVQAGIARANTLAEHGPGIRALKEAYAQVTLDERTGAVHKLGAPACRVAVQHLDALSHTAPDFMLTVEPLGPRSLATLLAPCRS
jgi:hypothetical protein